MLESLSTRRLYICFISFPVAGIAFVTMMSGAVLGFITIIYFIFQIVCFWKQAVWLPQGSVSLFFEINEIYFVHVSHLFGGWVSDYLRYAYTAKFILSSLMLLVTGFAVGILNEVNLGLADNKLYFFATLILMGFYYTHLVSYLL